jgi:putative ABC transport system substrate-binding protein
MKRRELITLLGGAAAVPSILRPLVAQAQQKAMPVVGFLHSQSPDRYAHVVAGFRRGLKAAGYVEGENVAVEYRWASNQLDRLPDLAADLVRRKVAVIVVAGGTEPAIVAKRATSTIPIVLAFGADPVKLGLVASLSRPGGNVTGATFVTSELGSKRFALLRELIPDAKIFAFLSDPRTVAPIRQEMTAEIVAAARVLGKELILVEARDSGELEAAFATMVRQQAGALIVNPDPLFTANRDRLLALAARHQMPTIYHLREFAADGGLMSYGASMSDAFRLGGSYVGQILKGAKPADLPVQQPTRFELVINLATARSLGLTVPITLLVTADEVIE